MKNNTKLINYYKSLIKKDSNPNHIKYYNNMIYQILNPQKKEKQEWKTIYVGSLDKVFKSCRKASEALGRDKNYVYKVLKGKVPNKHNIEQIKNNDVL